jgi:hypothetical protein
LYILDTERMERITDMYAVTYSENWKLRNT